MDSNALIFLVKLAWQDHLSDVRSMRGSAGGAASCTEERWADRDPGRDTTD
jgi:hypothetical protein